MKKLKFLIIFQNYVIKIKEKKKDLVFEIKKINYNYLKKF